LERRIADLEARVRILEKRPPIKPLPTELINRVPAPPPPPPPKPNAPD
jgi:hypothetical protein